MNLKLEMLEIDSIEFIYKEPNSRFNSRINAKELLENYPQLVETLLEIGAKNLIKR